MKSKRVATLNAGKFKIVFHFVKNWEIILLTGLLLIAISCTTSDDFELIENELPVGNESPTDDEIPTDDETTVDENSHIIYTDVEPDFTSEKFDNSYSLDLNNDGIADFILRSDPYDLFIHIESANGLNGIAAVSGPFDAYIVPLNKNTLIGANPKGCYYDSYGGIMVLGCNTVSTYCSYDWKDTTDKYLGLVFKIKAQRYYGWARLQVISTALWVVKDFAYNASPGESILAGQKE